MLLVCDKALVKFGLKRDQTRVVIQGFGNVGSVAATLMHQAGYRIVGLADIYVADFTTSAVFDIPKVTDWVHRQRKPLPEFPGGGARMTAQEVLFQPADIVIPAAVENQITRDNAQRLQTRILCEGANGPSTAYADEWNSTARESSSFLIFFANAGGVTVSYFEWVQDRGGFFWRESEVNERLKEILERSFDDVVSYAEKNGVNNRIAAYMLATSRSRSVCASSCAESMPRRNVGCAGAPRAEQARNRQAQDTWSASPSTREI